MSTDNACFATCRVSGLKGFQTRLGEGASHATRAFACTTDPKCTLEILMPEEGVVQFAPAVSIRLNANGDTEAERAKPRWTSALREVYGPRAP